MQIYGFLINEVLRSDSQVSRCNGRPAFLLWIASAWSSSFIVYGMLLCASFGCASRFFSNGAGKQDVVFGLLPLIATGLKVMVAGVDDVACIVMDEATSCACLVFEQVDDVIEAVNCGRDGNGGCASHPAMPHGRSGSAAMYSP
jgi:hypothetical protein